MTDYDELATERATLAQLEEAAQRDYLAESLERATCIVNGHDIELRQVCRRCGIEFASGDAT